MQYICAPVYSCFNTWSYTGKQWPQTFANNTFTPDSYIWLNCIIYFHWHYCHTAVLFLFLKLPRNKVEGPGGLLTEPLVWLWKCEIRNVSIHLGDREDTPNLVAVQVFQLTQLLSEDEDRKIQNINCFHMRDNSSINNMTDVISWVSRKVWWWAVSVYQLGIFIDNQCSK